MSRARRETGKAGNGMDTCWRRRPPETSRNCGARSRHHYQPVLPIRGATPGLAAFPRPAAACIVPGPPDAREADKPSHRHPDPGPAQPPHVAHPEPWEPDDGTRDGGPAAAGRHPGLATTRRLGAEGSRPGAVPADPSGLRVPAAAGGGVRGRVLLARLSPAFDAAQAERGLLAREDRGEPQARPGIASRAPGAGMDGDRGLGAHPEVRADPGSCGAAGGGYRLRTATWWRGREGGNGKALREEGLKGSGARDRT